ncbi:MAG: ACT domain-containing protein [Selenomonas sp.]|jgi:chorismate mutase|nr:ACT domain-containing protein [Selenomonas sp.]MCI7331739.1 ACT domain-containing protein [Selenomonadaceae bacterium]MDD6119727.1 ACT domain-containing protein [Selenomonadaceae bacterium]MDD7056270.1 ACT domain-containing protein [Selenomonadaceae bacterium]MDY3916115.1 ACT domain-containing protein [Selenomonadaceae bacterium]
MSENEQRRNGFFLVREEILPEAIKKTIRVKEMLKRGDAKTINEAVERMELSRSAYYKYKDYVFPFYEASKNKIVTLTFLLEHKKGVLSSVLNAISSDGGSVMTINQGIPLQGVANATVSIETLNLTIDLEALLDKLRMIDGVKRLEVLGQA